MENGQIGSVVAVVVVVVVVKHIRLTRVRNKAMNDRKVCKVVFEK